MSLNELRVTTEQELVELFEERAAIMEYDGSLDRAEAEKQAYFDIKTRTKTKVMPPEVQSVVKRAMDLLMERRKGSDLSEQQKGIGGSK